MTFPGNSSLLLIFFNFHLEVTWSSHVLHLWYKGNQRQSRKSLAYYLVCRDKYLCYENYFIVCLLLKRGITTPWNLLKIFVLFLYSSFIYFDEFPLHPNFQRVHSVGDCLYYCMHLLTCVCFSCCHDWLERPTNFILFNV